MKRISIILLLCVALLPTLRAQIQFSAGPGLGFNYAVHTSSEDDETISHFGVLVTSQFDMQFSRNFGLLVWIDLFNDMSAKQDVDDVSGEYKINYLHLSPTLKYCFSGSPFYLFCGPGIGIKTKGKVKASYEGLSMEADIPDMNTRVDLRFGLGYDFFLTNKITLSPFATFNAGLNDVAADTDWQIHTLQTGFVLRFNAF